MHRIHNIWRIVTLAALTLFVLVSGQSPVQAQQADQIIERLNQKYQSLDALRAGFVQEISYPHGNNVTRMSGSLLLSGEKYRVETEHQHIVTDGVTTWVYNKPENQVLVADHEENDDFISPSTFFSGYTDRYDASYAGREQVGGTPHDVVTLTPTDRNAFVQEVTLWIRASDAIVTRMQVTDINETSMEFQLQDIDLNPSVAADAFRFTAPAGAEVVDLRN